MNDPKKVLKVNSSSLVDLKAELIRKQQEFRKEKVAGGSKSALLAAKRAAHKKVSVFSKKNAGVAERSERDIEEQIEEENTLQRSRNVLEAKAKLYEKLASGGGLDLPDDESEGGRFLVDFQQKSVDDALHKRLESRRREELEEQAERNKLLEEEKQKAKREAKEAEEERKELMESVPDTNDPDEQWVDYIDEFGRSRRCLSKDLPSHKKQQTTHAEDKSELVDSSRLEIKEKDLMSEDMYREMLREKWEAEQEELLNKQDTVHYANVRFDEKRTHGVGFYDLAKDEDSRQEQLKALGELRNQTLDARERKNKLKEKRKAVMAARLAKVRQRKMINNPEDSLEKTVDSDDEEEDLIGPSISEAVQSQKPELLTRDETLRKNAPVREWDKGKQETSTWLHQPERDPEKNYIESRRDERESEFAPPQMYYESKAGDNSARKRQLGSNDHKPNIFQKLDAMAALDKTHNKKSKDFGPPSDYFTVPVKKVKQEEPRSSVTDNISSGLSKIRAEVERGPAAGNLSDIPLPPEKQPSDPSWKNTDSWKQMEPQFYPGHFYPGPYPNMPPPPPGVMAPHYYPPGNFYAPPGFPRMGYDYNRPTMPHPATDPSFAYGNLVGVTPGQENPVAHYTSSFENNAPQNVPSANQAPAQEAAPQNAPSTTQAPKVPAQEEAAQTAPEDSEQTEEKSSLTQAPPVGGNTISAKPMIYNRIGSRTDAPLRPRYERVHLHQVPLTLPAPPSAANLPHYPSQEEVHKAKKDKQEKDSERQWLKQYNDSNKPSQPNKAKIPFPSPYVQNDPSKKDSLFETAGFDPSKPPPNAKDAKDT